MDIIDDDSSYDDEDRAVSSDASGSDSDAEAKPLTSHAPHSTVEGAYVSLHAALATAGTDAEKWRLFSRERRNGAIQEPAADITT